MRCYRCGMSVPAGAAHCPGCGEAVYAIHTGGAPVGGRRLNGCLFGDPSPRSYRATPRASGLPRKVDLRADCSPIEDQGQIGSCTANAACGALEYHEKTAHRPQVPLSRMFVYFNARRRAGRVPQDSGAQIAEAMAALLAYGAPEEQRWPYDVNLFAAEPPPDIFAEALRRQAPEYARVERGTGTLGALAHGYPVVFGISLPMRCFQEAGDTGLIPVPTSEERAQAATQGGHAMLMVGYDQDEETYLLRNSWGTGWGNQGYCRIPFRAVEENTRPDDFWILGKLDADGAFQVVRPGRPAVEGTVAGMAARMREEIRGSLVKDIADAGKDIRDRLRGRPRDVP